MSENNQTQLTSVSKASTVEAIVEFWETHSLADYWDQTHEVNFTVTARRRHRVTLDPEIYEQVEVEARTRGILPETLVNLLLADRLHGIRVNG